MTDDASGEAKIGAIEWRDLSVENAEELRDFYAAGAVLALMSG